MLRYLITVLISIVFLFNTTLFAQSKLGELVVERTEYTKLQTDVVDTYRPGLLVVSVYTDIQGLHFNISGKKNVILECRDYDSKDKRYVVILKPLEDDASKYYFEISGDGYKTTQFMIIKKYGLKLYLDVYGRGNEVAQASAMLDSLKEENELLHGFFNQIWEANEAKGYMDIFDMDFGNADDNLNLINPYGSSLTANEIKYLSPRIHYDGRLMQSRNITVNVKIYRPDGTLMSGSSSPDGYSYSANINVVPGMGNSTVVSAWGNSAGGTYSPGLYNVEIWYGERMLYSKSVGLKGGDIITESTSGNLKIMSMEFCNVDYEGNIIDNYGKSLFADEIKYLKPKITYYGLNASSSETFYVKIFKPDGTLSQGKTSPDGYTYSTEVTLAMGQNQIELSGWGNSTGGSYSPGIYNVELWHSGKRLYGESVELLTDFVIYDMDFANADHEGNLIVPFGSELMYSQMQYLQPRIFYNSYLSEPETIMLDLKVYNRDGTLKTGKSSPDGYSYSTTVVIQPGKGKNMILTGWGNSSGDSYLPGTYKVELWYKGKKLYTKSVRMNNDVLCDRKYANRIDKVVDYISQKLGNGVYKGQLFDSRRSGLGLYLWDVDSFYFGGWKNNDKSGNSIYVASKGYIVTNCDDCVYYVGNYVNGNKSGKGTCYDEYGNLIYYGDFVNDEPVDDYPTTENYSAYTFGYEEYDSGDIYLGEYKNGKRHGRGIYIWESGDVWYGQWSDGERDGYGIFMPYHSTSSFVTGTWKANEYLSN